MSSDETIGSIESEIVDSALWVFWYIESFSNLPKDPFYCATSPVFNFHGQDWKLFYRPNFSPELFASGICRKGPFFNGDAQFYSGMNVDGGFYRSLDGGSFSLKTEFRAWSQESSSFHRQSLLEMEKSTPKGQLRFCCELRINGIEEAPHRHKHSTTEPVYRRNACNNRTFQ